MERVKANEYEIRSVNHLKEVILNSAGEGIIALDEFGKINYCNYTGLQLTGYQYSDIKNQTFHNLFQHTRENGEPWPEKDSSITFTLTKQEAYQVWEEIFWKNDGSYFPVEFVTAPIIEDDILKGTVIVFQDISQRKKSEEIKIRSTIKKEIIQETSRAKSIFLSRMTHELRTPLNSILGFGSLLKKRLGNQLGGKDRDSVQIILDSGDRLHKVINNILDLSHIEAGTLQLKPISLAVQVLVSGSIDKNSSYAEQNGIRIIHKKMNEPYINAWVDPKWLSVALNHILVNAIQYNSERGTVTIDYIFLNNLFGVRISDTGQGIPENRLEEIFESFNRLDADKISVKGAGIGLTISQKILQLMGGSIQIESTIDKGSCFSILLPIKKNQGNI